MITPPSNSVFTALINIYPSLSVLKNALGRNAGQGKLNKKLPLSSPPKKKGGVG